MGETIGAYSTFVIGGPNSSNRNGNPTFDVVQNLFFLGNDPFNDDAFGIALFDTTYSATLPVHAIIYGTTNTDFCPSGSIAASPTSGATPIQSVRLVS